MASYKQRIAETEALFRAGNDRMIAWQESRDAARRGERLTFFCECGRRHCGEQVRLTAEEYEAVRANAMRFIVAPGHELPDVEDVVVERHDRYLVVEKHEDVRDVVERMDLRNSGPHDP
jgi:hypothetical protein